MWAEEPGDAPSLASAEHRSRSAGASPLNEHVTRSQYYKYKARHVCWVYLFHILHVKYEIKIPNMSCFFFMILASDLFLSSCSRTWLLELGRAVTCQLT